MGSIIFYLLIYCTHSKSVNLPRRRLEFKPGKADTEAAQLE